MTSPDQIAKNVVIKTDKYAFIVDGEDFPWWLSERGPIVTQVHDDLYTVDVEICLLDKTDDYHAILSFTYNDYRGLSVPNIPIIGGKDFPWLLTTDGCQLNFGHKIIPLLKLTFFARNVTSDGVIIDRRVRDDIYCNGGNLIMEGES